jgi:hypothetical protein
VVVRRSAVIPIRRQPNRFDADHTPDVICQSPGFAPAPLILIPHGGIVASRAIRPVLDYVRPGVTQSRSASDPCLAVLPTTISIVAVQLRPPRQISEAKFETLERAEMLAATTRGEGFLCGRIS